MLINFQQGIISYPFSGPLQLFLVKTGSNVDLSTASGQIDVAFAHGTSNYLLTEATTVPAAWGPITNGVDTWLFWDINRQTAVRTFGTTTLQPQVGTSFPASPSSGQHFFNTVIKKMYVFESGVWREVIRVFAAKVNTATFTPLGTGFPGTPYAGTQVGLSGTPTRVGRILIDGNANPVRKPNGEFFTTEDDFFINGSPVNTIRLEANVITATALQNIAAFQVVRYTQFGKVELATYNSLQTTAIAMAVEAMLTNDVGTVITQGTVTNNAWSWTTAGAPLWVNDVGELTETDLFDGGAHPVRKPPIARVLTPTTIFFDQGLGGQGDQGPIGPAGTPAVASDTVLGVTKLSLPAVSPSNPIAVGDNDPRMTDARTPSAHIQAATTVTFTPTGSISSTDVQAAIAELATEKLNLTGGTLLGPLVLAANPVDPLEPATKVYVDSRNIGDLADVTPLAPSLGDVLTYDGGVWTNLPPAGGGVIEPDTQIVYGTGVAVDSSPTLTYNVATGAFNLSPTANATPGDVNINAADGFGTDIDGGDINIIAGTPTGFGTPGIITLTAGNNDTVTIGASINLTGADGTGTTGSSITITAGEGLSSGDDGGNVTVSAGSSADSNGGNIDISAGQGFDVGPGGNIDIVAGNSSLGNGGNIDISAGQGFDVGSGGDIDVSAGNSSLGNGGNIDISAGQSSNVGTGGNINITAGNSSLGDGGAVNISAGTASGGATPGNIINTTSAGFWQQQAGGFSVSRDAQSNMYILRTETTNATPTEMFLDGPGGSKRMLVAQDSTWRFEINVVARRNDALNESAAYEVKGCVDNNSNTTAIVGLVSHNVTAEDNTNWDVTVDADDTNDALRIRVTGEVGKDIRWVAFVRTVEVVATSGT